MKCDLCGQREAVVFVHQVSKDGNSELRLCVQCAREHGLGSLDGDMTEALKNLLSTLPASAFTPKGSSKKIGPCPHCGLSREEAKKRGTLGCPHCWEHFGKGLLEGLSPTRGSPKTPVPLHQGRLSLRLTSLRIREQELVRLREELAEAVSAENYELAARYRDQIRALEGSGGSRG
jgi:protein arginine kinase activator